MSKRLVMYMSPWCSTSADTQRALNEWQVAATMVNIKEDRAAAARVKEWVGFESSPTLLIAEGDSLEPYEPPAPLAAGKSPLGSIAAACSPKPRGPSCAHGWSNTVCWLSNVVAQSAGLWVRCQRDAQGCNQRIAVQEHFQGRGAIGRMI